LSKWIRQIHRSLSVVFTLAVLVTTIALSQKGAPPWVSYLALPPLGLLLLSGLYLFVLPYAAKDRSGRRTN